MEYFDPVNTFFKIKIHNFRGDLSDISAKTATMVETMSKTVLRKFFGTRTPRLKQFDPILSHECRISLCKSQRFPEQKIRYILSDIMSDNDKQKPREIKGRMCLSGYLEQDGKCVMMCFVWPRASQSKTWCPWQWLSTLKFVRSQLLEQLSFNLFKSPFIFYIHVLFSASFFKIEENVFLDTLIQKIFF